MRRGKLRVYLGAAPGVGKTYAMLDEAHRRRARGTDVVVALVETHQRPKTVEMLGDLEVLARRQDNHRGALLAELDVEALIARNPQVALIDELAHSNPPTSANEKRWQDVSDVLEAGIDVITTLNIQHLESLNDVVAAITGTVQRETVPDHFVRTADSIQIVDMSPEALRRRLAHGNVYEADQIDAALTNYFRVGNLTALRELALLWLADRVDEGLDQYRTDHKISQTWATRDRIVVAITGGPESRVLLRRGAQVAGRNPNRDLMAVHVLRSDGTADTDPSVMNELRRYTEELGGTFHVLIGDRAAEEILQFARTSNASRVLIAESRRNRFSTALFPSTADLVIRGSGDDLDVQIVTRGKSDKWFGARLFGDREVSRHRWILGCLLALALPAITSLALTQLDPHVDIAATLLALLVCVMIAAIIGGLAAAVVAAITSTLVADYFFTEPTHSLSIANPHNVTALLMFAVVGCTMAAIVNHSYALAARARSVQADAEVLQSLAATVITDDHAVSSILEQARTTFGMHSAALVEVDPVAGETVVIESVVRESVGRESIVRESVVRDGIDSTARIASLNEADVVIEAGPGIVLAMRGRAVSADQRRILSAFAVQAAAVLERDRLMSKAREAERLRASEDARSAIFAAVSHDLQTPIAGIKAAVSTLGNAQLKVSASDNALLIDSIRRESERLADLVGNLLDMSRISTGSVTATLTTVSVDELIHSALSRSDASPRPHAATDASREHKASPQLIRFAPDPVDSAAVDAVAVESAAVDAVAVESAAVESAAVESKGADSTVTDSAITSGKEVRGTRDYPRSVASATESRGVRVELDVPEDLPLVVTDFGLMERVLVNVINNAVQHGGCGEVVYVRAATSTDVSNQAVEIRVVDKGPGVQTEDIEAMFEPFQRLSGTTGEGLGLGLAVARGLSAACGSSIAAEETPGGGVTMVITMPLPEDQPSAHSSYQAEAWIDGPAEGARNEGAHQ